ncbi:HlyD family secretion protein [Yersinia aleksiciae]|uniref:Colicin V secretion protein CvaA n=1 Tax=Yersinia aleksiciae TaxID=263819 RepID=A0ABN4H941_YERAE|nr:HlyD family secretion protein [Yersinia aleksiciae]AKP33528.1 colicin V secretion protein CvaA [Yersinia aleksiciae]CFQ40503.1 putative secretion permease [Yersinia aleksiciae]
MFRQEVFDYQKTKWTGKALLISGVPPWVVATVSLTIIIVFISAIMFGNYTRRINVSGEVTTLPRSINIFASQQGYITKTLVKVGDDVVKGQAIYQIDIGKVTDSGRVSQNNQQAIERQLTQVDSIIKKLQSNKTATLSNIQDKKKKYEAAYKQSSQLVKDSQENVESMRKIAESYSEYQRQGLITKEQVNNQTYSYYQQQSAFQGLYNQNMQEALQITNLDSEIITRSADFDNQISKYQLQYGDLQRQLAETVATGVLVINAPATGRIESLSVTTGQMVNMGDSLAQLVPGTDATYYLVLWLPNHALPYVTTGDRVNVRYDAFPFEKFGQFSGRIDTLSTVPASIQEMESYNNAPLRHPEMDTESYYKALIELDKVQFSHKGKTRHLAGGMKAQSTLFLEKRPLYQWMFSPFYDMKKSLMGPVHE